MCVFACSGMLLNVVPRYKLVTKLLLGDYLFHQSSIVA